MENRETIEIVTDFIFLGSKIIADGDCSHEIKRHLVLGREVMKNLDNVLKSRDINLRNELFRKVRLAEINNVVELKLHIRDAVAVLVDRQAQSAPYLLQLADLTAAGPQLGNGEHIRIIPPLLQRPLGEEKPPDIPLAILVLER